MHEIPFVVGHGYFMELHNLYFSIISKVILRFNVESKNKLNFTLKNDQRAVET